MRASCRSGFPLIVFPNSSTTAVGNIEKGGHIDRSVSRKTKPNPHAPPLLHPVFPFSTFGPPFFSHRSGSPFFRKLVASSRTRPAALTVPLFNSSLSPRRSDRDPTIRFVPALGGRQHLVELPAKRSLPSGSDPRRRKVHRILKGIPLKSLSGSCTGTFVSLSFCMPRLSHFTLRSGS